MTDVSRLINQIEDYLKPTKPGQYAVAVSRRFLVDVLAQLSQHEQRIAAIETAASRATNDLVAELYALRASSHHYYAMISSGNHYEVIASFDTHPPQSVIQDLAERAKMTVYVIRAVHVAEAITAADAAEEAAWLAQQQHSGLAVSVPVEEV
jgi:hypothetical protein